MLGVLLTTWTIRLALVGYVAYVGGGLVSFWSNRPHLGRLVWSVACGLFVVHVACAFHFYHRWSHAVAWETTAAETKQQLGFAFGDGIYFSYLFLLLWVLDVLWLWTSGSRPGCAAQSATAVPQSSNKTPWWRVWVHVFLFFIALNGAVVFESGPTRWAGFAAIMGLAALAGVRGYNGYVQRELVPDSGKISECKIQNAE